MANLIKAAWGPLLIALVCVPLALEMMGPNPIYGVRTSASLASQEVWYRANFYAGVTGVLSGLIGAIANLRIARSSLIAAHIKPWLTLGVTLVVAACILLAGLASA